MASVISDEATRLTASPDSVPTDVSAWSASLATMPEEMKTMIAKALAERTEKPTLEHYYPRDVQLYQVDKLKHLAQVNREWALVCESLRSQEVAANCGSGAIKSLSIHLDEANMDSVAALSHVLAACPNVDRISLNLFPLDNPSEAIQQMASTIGDWMDSRTFHCVRVFFDNHNDFLLAQVPHGHVTTPLLDLATQPGSYNRANSSGSWLSLPACQALTHVRGVQDYTADCNIPIEYLTQVEATKNWWLIQIAAIPRNGTAGLWARLVPLLQLHAKTIGSLRIEDELDSGAAIGTPIPERSLVLPRLTELEDVVAAPSLSVQLSDRRRLTFLDLLHPTTPVEFLRCHLNTDSITSLCDFIKEQNPPRLRRIEACVRVRVKWYRGNLPEEDQSAALRSLCKAKDIEVRDPNCVEYTG
ncbi:hypothetical protein C6P46_001950 [Rhodotorula mucilaginosa]|uniref:Uncharacterized protein n=1 Tax=Rhodotorula mucilaginosa TaxID=5537 RepID=A0A9P6VS99_RHOMI|nr:hypothetical protein C6P46_001950 [Rhodotorula mucilaginosa]